MDGPEETEPPSRAQALRPWAVGIIGLLVAFWFIGSSASFQDCMRQQNDEDAKTALQQSGAVVGGSIIRLPSRVVCAGDFTDKNQGPITALATVLIAVFTYILRNATKRLWESAERQLTQFRRSINTADEHASHMAASVKEAARAADAIERLATGAAANMATVAEMSRTQRAFWQMQMRAYVTVVIGTAVYQDRKANLRFEGKPMLVNTGHTPAHRVRQMIKADILPIPLARDIDWNLPSETTLGGTVVAPQQNRILSAMVQRDIFDGEVADIKTGKGRALVVWGTVTYDDVFGVTHFTNFCQFYTWIGAPPRRTNHGVL